MTVPSRWSPGQRVFVPDNKSSRGLICRTGTVLEHEARGVRVRHDHQAEGHWFGWASWELHPISSRSLVERLVHRLRGWLVRLPWIGDRIWTRWYAVNRKIDR